MRCASCHRRVSPAHPCPVHPQAVEPRASDALEVPRVPHHAIGGELGAGGFSVVYRATDDADRPRAIKVARAATALVRERFARERTALASVSPPAVPALHGAGELADGRPYLLLELIEGPSLAERMCEHTPGNIDAAIRFTADIARSLVQVHRAELVHRDLKPENIIAPVTGGARLLDFGLALTPDDPDPTRTGVAVGSVEYAAPEQLRGDRVDHRADLYSLGVILYELLAGRPPFVGGAAEVERGHLTLRPSPFEVPVPAGLDALVRTLLAKPPGRRPPHARAVLDALGGAVASGTPTARRRAPGKGRSRDAVRPVVLLALEGTGNAAHAADVVREHGGVVARQRGAGLRCAFVADGHHTLAAALAASERITADEGARAVVDLVDLRVRHRAQGVALHGEALDRDGWLPAARWTGTLFTPAAAAALPAGASAPSAHEGFSITVDRIAGADPPMIGRAAELERARAAVEAARRQGRPALVTIQGARGTGKSRFARELCAALAGPLETVVATQPVGSDPAATMRELLGAVCDLEPAAIAELLTGAAASRFGPTRTLGEGLRARARDGAYTLWVDDAHWADDASLDALENATRAALSHPLCIVVAADESFADLRRSWGHRAGVHVRVDLGALDGADATALARRLLEPARRVPRRVVDRLVAWAGGNPAQLTALVRQLEHEGVVRRHGDTNAWYVAEDELDALASSPANRWLVASALAALPPELADFARLCAALAGDFTEAELEFVQREVAWSAVQLDVQVGLQQACRAGLLVTSGDGYRIASPPTRDALQGMLDADRRRAVHAAAHRYWSTRAIAPTHDRLYRLAYHAARSGRLAEARVAYRGLAEAARRRHAYAEADLALSRAIELGDDQGAAGVDLRIERGWVRLLQTHYEEAMADLELARARADEHGLPVAAVEAMVLAAAVCDHTERLAESAALIDRAIAAAPADLPPRVQARLHNWTGVVRFRQQRVDEAITHLSLAAALGDALGEHVTRVGSMLSLGPSLRLAGRNADGDAVLDAAIDACERAADYWHLAVGLINRIERWRDEGDLAAAEADRARATELAVEYGFDWIEIYGNLNMSEVLFRAGRAADAVPYAARAHSLGVERFGTEKLAVAGLYFAQLLVFAGQIDRAGEVLAELASSAIDSAPSLRLSRQVIALAVSGADDQAWERTLGAADSDAVGDQALELAWLRGRVASLRGDRDAAARALDAALAEAERVASPLAPLIARDLEAARADRTSAVC